jgi:hypothetical protein
MHLSRCSISTLLATVLLVRACAITVAAQQAGADNPCPAVPASSTTAVPSQDSAPQAAAAAAQTSGADGSAPQNPLAQSAQQDSNGQQTKRILGIVPNFRAVSADTKLPPETVKEKFIDATEDSFDYSSIFIPGVIAAYNLDRRTTPQFHEGAAGYARYFWHSAVDQSSENYMVEFIFPTFTREDARYYTSATADSSNAPVMPSAAPSSPAQTRDLKSSTQAKSSAPEPPRESRISITPPPQGLSETQCRNGPKMSVLTQLPSGSRSSGPTSTAMSSTTSTVTPPRRSSRPPTR